MTAAEEIDRRYFKKENINALEILTKWAQASGVSFSGLESSVINSAMIEFSELRALECIKADRIQVAENAKTTISKFEGYGSMGEKVMKKQIIVDKESIINCPIADLK